MSTLLVQPSSILGDGSQRGIATTNQLDVDCFLFVTCSSAVTSPIESIISPGKYQLILPNQQDLVDLSDIISVFCAVDCAVFSNIVLRNYLEPGNFFVCDSYGHASLHYCVIGDTHHLSQSLTWCLDRLRHLKPHFFFSRSNPQHAILLAQCLERSYGLQTEYAAAPDYLLVEPETLSIQKHERATHDALLCISNLQFQLGRKRLIKKLLCLPDLLASTHFFSFLPESCFRDLLFASRYLLIPSINGQVSPQIFYAISHGCLPVVDCHTALQVSGYHRELLPILGSLQEVVGASSFPETSAALADFISLSLHLKSVARSEVSFVQLFLSSHPLLRQLFIPGIPSDLCNFTPSSVLQAAFEKVSSHHVLSRLDAIKMLSLREPFLCHQYPLEQAYQSLAEGVCHCDLHTSVALSLEAIRESRRWL